MKCPNPLFNHGLKAYFHRLRCRECRQNRATDRAIELVTARMRQTPVADAPHGLLERLGLDHPKPARPMISLQLAAVGVCAVAIVAFLVASQGRHPEPVKAIVVRTDQHGSAARINSNEMVQAAAGGGASKIYLPDSPKPHGTTPGLAHREDNPKAPVPVVADNDYLNPGKNGAAPVYTGAAPIKPLTVLAMKDDFVQPSPLLLAFNDSGGLAKIAEQDKARIQQEAKTTDVRLYKAISLGMKHASMTELCAELSRQTGATIEAGRNVADDNLTIFVTARPARDVMRGISRVFGFIWERSGEEGHFQYTLKQDTTAQIGEEMIRNTDVSKALEKIASQARRETGKDNERTKTVKAALRELSASDLDTLRSGRTLVLSSQPGPSGTPTLDPALTNALLTNMGGVIKRDGMLLGAFPEASGQEDYVPYTKMAEAYVIVSLRLRITEFGGAVVDSQVSASGKVGDKWGGRTYQEVLDSVPGLAEAPIDNAQANAALKSSKGMSAPVALRPEPTTPLTEQNPFSPMAGQPATRDGGQTRDGKPLDLPNLPQGVVMTADLVIGNYQFTAAAQPPKPWMTSDDLWEAVHVATKSDVIADSYSRLFALKNVDGDLFTALNAACDRMQYRWGLSEGFVTGRSAAFHWQRLNEVPKRLLQRWQIQRRHTGYLGLESVLEMARLSDRQLDAREVGKTVYCQWKLPEWGVLSRPFMTRQYNGERMAARFMAALSPAQLSQLQQGTLTVGDLSREILDMVNYDRWRPFEAVAADVKLSCSYVPPLKYYWHPLFEEGVETVRTDLILADTSDAVEREVDRRFPDRKRPNEIAYSLGLLGLTINLQRPLTLGDYRYTIGHVIKD